MRRCFVLLVLAGCLGGAPDDDGIVVQSVDGKTKCKPHKKHADCGSATATVGTSGGTITTDSGASIAIPYGALDGDTTISVTTTTEAPPSGIGATSPVYEFQPEGIVFAKPVTVTLPMPAGVTTGSVYWSQLGGTGYDAIGGTVANGTITAQTVHFSLAVIGQVSTTRTVTGVGETTYISASSRQSVPIDFTQQTVEAIVSDGNGGFATIPGTGGTGVALGTFTIPNVPVGEYILHAGSTYLATTSNTPDLGHTAGGRANRTPLTTSVPLTLNLSNLAPWDVGNGTESADALEWFSSEADDWDFNTERFAPVQSGDTATSLTMDVLHVDAGNPSEIHPAQGDHAAVGQLVLQHTATGVAYVAMQRVAQFPSTFDVTNNGPAQTVSLALTDVSLGNTLSVDYRGSQWGAALATYGNPAHRPYNDPDACPTTLCGGFVGALAQGYSADDGFYTANADLLLMFDDTGQDIVSGDMHYADPAALGGTWGVLVDVRHSQRTILQLPDTSGRAGRGLYGFPDYVEWTTTLAAAQAGPITPPLLPPTAITVNGIPFFDGGGDVGETPTFQWQNPNSGAVQPAFYTVGITELYVDQHNRSRGTPVATINTPDTMLTLPPGILQVGHAYVFHLSATASTSATSAALLAASPFKSSIDLAEAGVVSGIFGNVHGTPLAHIVQSGQNYPLGMTADATHVYWAEHGDSPWDPPSARNNGTIWAANLDGSNPHPIATGQDEPYALAVAGNTLYWTNEGDWTDGVVMSMDLTTNVLAPVASAQNYLTDIESFGGDVYWESGSAGTMRLHQGVASQVTWEAGENVCTDGTNVYVTRYGDGQSATGGIDYAPVDGSAPPVSLVTGQPQTWDVHTDGSYVYFSNQAWQQAGQATINRVPIGGGTIQTLTTGNELMKFFALDNGTLYFVRNGFVWALPASGGAPLQIAAVPNFGGCPQGHPVVAGGAFWFTDTCSQEVYRVPL